MSDYAAVPDESGHIDVPGGKVWYRLNRSANSGAVPLIVLHGGPGNSHDYLLPLLELVPDRSVVLYDQLDCGRSQRVGDTRNWTLERFTDEIDAVREHLGLGQVHLFASSWGCSIAINYAARQPAGLCSLALSGPLVDAKRWMADCERLKAQLPDHLQAVMRRCEAQRDFTSPEYLEAVNAFYVRHLCRVQPWPQIVVDTMDNCAAELYGYMWGPTEFFGTGTLADLDLTPKLASIEVPTLFMCGAHDEGTPESGRAFAAMVRGAEFCCIPEASHMPHIENPEPFFRHLRAFIAKATPRT